MSWIFLSHELDESTPAYGGAIGFTVVDRKEISETSSSRKQMWKFDNHVGTHMDFPAHFIKEGKDLSHYSAHDFLFEKVAVVSVSVGLAHLITSYDVELTAEVEQAELLLLKTGFEARRGTEDYWKNGPGLHPETCRWLREKMPSLRAVGFDFISLTSYQHREAGREAHRVLLGKQGNKDGIWVIEDMKLSSLKDVPKYVLVAPLRVKGADGAPVSVFASMG